MTAAEFYRQAARDLRAAEEAAERNPTWENQAAVKAERESFRRAKERAMQEERAAIRR